MLAFLARFYWWAITTFSFISHQHQLQFFSNLHKNLINAKMYFTQICCYILFASWMHIIHNFFFMFNFLKLFFLWNDKHIYILTSFYYSLKIHTQTHFKKEITSHQFAFKNITSYKIIYLGICHFKVYCFILTRVPSYVQCLLHLIVYTSVDHCSVKHISYSCLFQMWQYTFPLNRLSTIFLSLERV